MADGYIEPPVVTDAEDLLARITDYIEANYPGWEANPANLETILGEAFASVAADVQDIARAQLDEQFRTFGSTVAGVVADEDIAATVTSTWTMIDDTGYTIPAGTQVGIPGPSGLVRFLVTDDVVVAPGDTATDAGEVTLEADTPGADANSLSGTPTLIDTMTFVSSIALVGSTSGGVTAETRDEYLDRLSSEYRLMTPRPILPDDFAVLLVNRVDGVARALALDGYNPNTDTFDNERTVSVVGHDDAGAALSAPVKASGETLLAAMREVNFDVFVIDPDFEAVTIDVTVKRTSSYSDGDIEDAVKAALVAYINPTTWGTPLESEQASVGWINEPTVYLFEVAEVINRVEGVIRIAPGTLEINGVADDFDLTGNAPLPYIDDPDTDINVTVTT